MNSIRLAVFLYLAIGFIAGAGYFLGLWWTVRRLPAVRQPALYTMISFLVRTAALLGIFFVVAQGDWVPILYCLAGFTISRVLMLGRIRPGKGEKAKDALHRPYNTVNRG
jgi:F1F0 ATPase subunit 2